MSTRGRSAVSFIGLFVVLAAVALGILLSFPSPELDWDNVVLPAAVDYMVTSMNVSQVNETHPLQGLLVAVTGATSGIGLGLTRRLVSLGATVVAIGRSPERLQRLKEELSVETVVADLGDLESVAQAADFITKNYDHLDVLVNNAGMHTAFAGLVKTWASPQGYDLPFAVNYLSHFLLTEKLMPLLRKSSHAKVVQVSSRFHLASDGSDLSTDSGTRPPIASQVGGSHGFFVYRSQRQYANSKLAQILHARSLQDRGLRAVSVCPTWVGTQIGMKNGTVLHSIFEQLAFDQDGFGLSSILHALLDTFDNGDFYINTDFGNEQNPLVDQLPAWTYQTLPIRDTMVASNAFTQTLLLQRFYTTRSLGRSSLQSYDKTLQKELYAWSLQAVSQWL